MTLYDIAPTVLYLAGLAVSEEMERRLLVECMEEAFLNNHPYRSVKTYGPPLRQTSSPVLPASEEEIKDRLRALGYID